jgi:membrane-associated phospholipid phosphatase
MEPAQYWRRALRRLFALYLFVSGLALFFPHRPRAWPVLALLHALAILVLLDAPPARRLGGVLMTRWPKALSFLRDWYMLLLVPLLYSELAVLNVAVHDGHYFDDIILRWEEQLFGGQPSRELAAAYPFLWLSELLHFCYIAYYVIIYGPFLLLYLRGRIGDHQRAAFAIMLTFFAHYVFFIYFPVQGPRYLFAAPGGEISSGVMYNLAHQILEAGSSRGAAFPSSHVGVSFAQTAMALVLLKRWTPLLIVLSTGLAVGAVYGGFHYATDAVAGFVFALLLVLLAPAFGRMLNGRET